MSKLPEISKNIVYFTLASFFLAVFSGSAIVFTLIVLTITLFDLNKTKAFIIKYKILLGSFILLAGFSSYYSIDPDRSFKYMAKSSCIVAMMICCLISIPKQHVINNNYVINCLIIIHLIIIFDNLTNYTLTKFVRELFSISSHNLMQPTNKVTTLISLILPTLLIYYYQKTLNYISLIVIIAFSYVVHPMCAAGLAISFSILMSYLGYKFGATIKYFYYSIIGWLLTAPVMFYYGLKTDLAKYLILQLPQSWLERVQMWQKVTLLIKQKIFFGYGFNSSFAINKLDFIDKTIIQIHPHNMFLQIWLEFGMVGAILVAVSLYYIFNQLLKTSDVKQRISYLSFISATLIFANVSFGIWQSWWLASIAIALTTIGCINRTKTLIS